MKIIRSQQGHIFTLTLPLDIVFNYIVPKPVPHDSIIIDLFSSNPELHRRHISPQFSGLIVEAQPVIQRIASPPKITVKVFNFSWFSPPHFLLFDYHLRYNSSCLPAQNSYAGPLGNPAQHSLPLTEMIGNSLIA